MNLAKGSAVTLILSSFLACGGNKGPSDAEKWRAQFCKPVESAHSFYETPFRGGSADILSFESIRSRVNTACNRCHQYPANKGKFSYVDFYQGREVTGGVWLPGFFETAEKMRDYIFHADENLRMPPKADREKNPEAFLAIGRQLESWIQAGKPNGTFQVGKVPDIPQGKPRPTKPVGTSELGDCTPYAKAVGHDYGMDRFFEAAEKLPKFLSETDLFALDPLLLAQRGTVAYNVEYPLWADNANKGRWMHIPMKIENGKLMQQAIEYEPLTKQFKIPENTRFYKTFYRAVTLPNKKIQMRRIETRIIVARTPWQNSLFGTYQWDETEQIATLVDAPYRDGTPFKDVRFEVVVDIANNKIRDYAIPGRQRCLDCHMGSPNQNFVLGFIPLQINKRQLGGGGRWETPGSSDLDQVERFISYGFLKGLTSGAELPLLENAGTAPYRNVHELRANGYMVGNCYHCHNPNGFAAANDVKLTLGPGDTFQFSTALKSTQVDTRKYLHQNGELESSHFWRKVKDPPSAQGGYAQMPMHTPGSPDCGVQRLMGKWIRSIESDYAAQVWEPECKKENPFEWTPIDFTWPVTDGFVPRRSDWADKQGGMPEHYRAIELSPSLAQTIRTAYPVDYFKVKPACKFPDVKLPDDQKLPWMNPKRNDGELFYSTPGAFFFRNTCAKCHGRNADGDSALAKSILMWSGGDVRVANFVGDVGMFGKGGENLKAFDVEGRSLAGNYLIWMAMEGTRVKFPPEVANMMGKHGGQMLNGIREKCMRQISISGASSPRFKDHQIFNKVCFMENLSKDHPDLQYNPATDEPYHPEKVEQWMDRAAWNAGWAIFEYLKEGVQGGWPPTLDECERVHPKEEQKP